MIFSDSVITTVIHYGSRDQYEKVRRCVFINMWWNYNSPRVGMRKAYDSSWHGLVKCDEQLR